MIVNFRCPIKLLPTQPWWNSTRVVGSGNQTICVCTMEDGFIHACVLVYLHNTKSTWWKTLSRSFKIYKRLPNAVTYVQIWACPWDAIQQKFKKRTGKTHLGPTTPDFVNNSLFPYHKIGSLNCSYLQKSMEKLWSLQHAQRPMYPRTAELLIFPKSKVQSRQIHDPCPTLHVNNFVASDTPRPHGCCICCLVLFPPFFQGKTYIGLCGGGGNQMLPFCVGRELEEGRKLQDMGTLGEFAHGSKLGHWLRTIDLGWIGTSLISTKQLVANVLSFWVQPVQALVIWQICLFLVLLSWIIWIDIKAMVYW